eukprot:GEMP01080822.1.p3 GENE.GEMP01080822.1~~GEMP01080822.1.p3  ORF type:complete len:120 (+),score=32.51 GEMP01080822.1:172-531(+)
MRKKDVDTAKEVKCAHFEYKEVDKKEASCKELCRDMVKGSFRVVCESEAKVVNRCDEQEYNWATRKLEEVKKIDACEARLNEIYACKTCSRFLKTEARDFVHDSSASAPMALIALLFVV